MSVASQNVGLVLQKTSPTKNFAANSSFAAKSYRNNFPNEILTCSGYEIFADLAKYMDVKYADLHLLLMKETVLRIVCWFEVCLV